MNQPPSDTDRIDGAENEFSALIRDVRAVQLEMSNETEALIIQRLKTGESKRLVASAGNYRAGGGIVQTFLQSAKKWAASLLKSVLRGFIRQQGRNLVYFEKAGGQTTDAAQNKALELAMARFGYDLKNNRLIEGGYFASLFGFSEIAQKVGGLIAQAIGSKMPLDVFRRAFRGVFVGRGGAGMLEKHFQTRSFDLFQAADRAMHKVLADAAGFSHWLYSGTLIETSRDFCVQNLARVFTTAEVEAWKKLPQFAKIIGYDPFLDLGGPRCRHHLSAISEQMYKFLIENPRPRPTRPKSKK